MTTFQGTYTKQNGLLVAAGTVAITPLGGSTTTETLDGSGHYSVAISTAEDEFTIVETLTGVAVKTYKLRALPGATVDTGRDIGHTGPVTTDVELSAGAHQVAVSAPDAVGSSTPAALTSAAPAALTSAAPAAATSGAVATTNAVDLATAEALANALKTSHNLAVADIAALVTELTAVQVDVAALRTTLAAVQTDLVTKEAELTAAQEDIVDLQGSLATLTTAHNAAVAALQAAGYFATS